MWKKLIKRGEKVGLGLTQAERKLLLTGLVFLHRQVEEAVRSTPTGEPVMLALGDLEDLAGHVAAEANHAKNGRTEDRLQGIYEKVEELLDLYAVDDRPAGAAKREIAPNDLGELLAYREPIVFKRPKVPGEKGRKYPIKMTPQQRESLIQQTRLRRGLKAKIERAPEGAQAIEFTRKELDELYDEIGGAIVHAPSPHKKRLTAVHVKIAAIFDQEQLVAYEIEAPEEPRNDYKQTGLIYQLKVTLAEIEPPVWRRVQVPDCTLGELHAILQVCMGWQDCHLHQFIVGGRSYGRPTPEDLDMEVEDEDGVLLSQALKGKKARIVYEYDFGDGWRHEVALERSFDPEPKVRYPRCIEGERACPPEDVGGPWGYADFLEAMADPQHEVHRDMKEWIGGRFDPEKFAVDAVNKELKRVFR